MLRIYIDETGDPGFLPGSSGLFLACALAVEDAAALELANALHARILKETGWRGELRWSRIPERIRKMTLPFLRDLRLPCHACLWRKRRPSGLRSAEIEAQVRAAALAPLIEGRSARVQVVLDGARDSLRSRLLREALDNYRRGDAATRLGIHWGESGAHAGLQLADLLAGWLLRRYLAGERPDTMTVWEI